MKSLFEKYRPTSFDEVVGQDKAVRQIRFIIDRHGAAGQAFWLTGPSGSGKTTLARIIANTIADDWMIFEFDSGADLTMAELNRVLDALDLCGAGKGGRAVIVNEAHSLRADVLDKLKGVLERIQRHVVWIFTTTREDQDQLFDDHVGAAQLISRCKVVPLTNQGLAAAFATNVARIATIEGLNGGMTNGTLEAACMKIIRAVKSNHRAALQAIDSGALIGA